MDALLRSVQALIGATVVVSLHTVLLWYVVTNESEAKPPTELPKPIQVSLIATAPPAVVENKTKPEAALPTPALPLRPKVEAPPPKAKPRPKPKKAKPKPKPKAKPRPKPKPKAIPKPQPKPQPVKIAHSGQPTKVATASKPAKSTSEAGKTGKSSTSRSSGSSDTARSTAAKVTKPSFRAGYLNNPPPEYPRASKRRGEEGRVLLKVRVSAQGKPIKIQLHKSSGFKRLDKAAQKTVKRWRFVPAKQGNTPIAAWVIVPIEFNLR